MLMNTQPAYDKEAEQRLNEEKRQRITAALKANPSRSDRMIARETHTSQPTAYRVRKELEAAGVIPVVPPNSRRIAPVGDRATYIAEIRGRIAEELKKDAARSNRAVGKASGTADSTVRVVRRELENEGLIPRVKNAARVTVKGTLGQDGRNGARVNIPDGMTVSSYVAAGIQMERAEGLSGEAAAKRLKITPDTYRRVKAAILLSQNPDLNKGDTAEVKSLLEKIDEDRFVGRHWEKLEPIVNKVWGEGYHHGASEKILRKRKEVFQHALSLINNTCVRAEEVEVPLLSASEEGEAVNELAEAIKALTKLKGKIRRGL